MKKILFSSVLCFFSFGALACDSTQTQGAPQAPNEGLISLCRINHHVMYSVVTKTPVWVAEDLYSHNVVGPVERTNSFRADPDLHDSIQSELSDYENSGYARGHMAPAANFQKNPEAERQSNYLSNIVPQIHKCNNTGVWSRIEDVVRDWAVHYGHLYVVTGPIFREEPKTIGSGVAVPDYLFKVVYNTHLNESMAFLVPNEKLCGTKPRNFAVTQQRVEELSGIKFFPYLSNYRQTNTLWQ